MSVPRRRLMFIGTVLLVIVAAGVTWFVVNRDDDDEPGRLGRAIALAPKDTLRFSWTDWAGIREELGSDVSAASSDDDVADFLSKGFDADLTSASALGESAPIMQARYGVSPASADWEMLAQGEHEALLLVGLPKSLDLDTLADNLEELGYPRPDDADGVWMAGPDVLARIGQVTQELAFVAIDADRHVLAASDEAETLESWRTSQRGTDDEDGVSAVVDHVEGALSASVYDGDYACVALSMTDADDADRIRAAELIEQAGEVNPLRGFAIAALPAGEVRIAMGFESEDQARTNADSRAKLASGPAPGQGGAFSDRYELGPVKADGDVVTMELDPLPQSYTFSDLANGPLIFATC
ncbi:hypothetical protein F0U44_04220 [Nocardioides humilatus]|uniref:DUF3352 domain-containing protein n=1 Tax=Nocardioides humilatus TaxID=2607660 RepID=A0A5B1LLU4_9ACTN|nr:hypothetical protein [Nocardioides humilatus]KAA1421503.1 hypothetical protein F0U44_04220 [Nocardioides humilatus]